MENPEGRRDITITDGEKTTGSSVMAAAIAAVVVVGPLFGMMSFSLVATVTMFLIVSPLMLIIVPVLTVTMAILVAAMVGVGMAAAMWLVGIAALVYCGRELGYGWIRYLQDKSEDVYSSSSSSSSLGYSSS